MHKLKDAGASIMSSQTLLRNSANVTLRVWEWESMYLSAYTPLNHGGICRLSVERALELCLTNSDLKIKPTTDNTVHVKKLFKFLDVSNY